MTRSGCPLVFALLGFACALVNSEAAGFSIGIHLPTFTLHVILWRKRLNANFSLYSCSKIKRPSNKGVAGAGRPPSLLVVATCSAESF